MEPPIDHRTLDRTEPTPVYIQLAGALRRKIATGEWEAHHQLTAEPALAQDLGVSRGTLRKALDILITEGLLRRVHGRGTFVLPRNVAAPFGTELSTVYEELVKRGVHFSTTVPALGFVPAPPEVADLLGIEAGTPLLRLERVRADDVGPIAYLVNYVLCTPNDGLEDVDFTTTALFEALEGRLGWKLTYGRRTVKAVAASGAPRSRLQVAAGAPLLLLEQVTFSADDTPVECSNSWINPTRMTISSLVQRNHTA